MPEERIFNLFVYFDNGLAQEGGVRFHRRAGSDEEKTTYLHANIDDDHSKARRFPLDTTYTPEAWRARMRIGNHLDHFAKILHELRAPTAMVFCLTPIVDDEPKWDQQLEPGAFRGEDVTSFKRVGTMPDYLEMYLEGQSFKFSELINDDYFDAIRVLFNAEKYVSSTKLLMSCIDTLAYVEHGDRSGNFEKWLEDYCDLSALDVSPKELWEYRNSILHMTNLKSRAVVKGKTTALAPYIARQDLSAFLTSEEGKPLNIWTLINVVAQGTVVWGESYNADPEKIIGFVERYDSTLSDKRIATVLTSDLASE